MGDKAVVFDDVFIDGREFKVDRRVADELIRLRMESVEAVLEKMKSIEPKEGETIIIYVPRQASQEFMVQVGDLAKMQFPGNRIAVLPESLDLHTAEGVAELIADTMTLVDAVNRDEGVHLDTQSAATALQNRILSRENEDEEE